MYKIVKETEAHNMNTFKSEILQQKHHLSQQAWALGQPWGQPKLQE